MKKRTIVIIIILSLYVIFKFKKVYEYELSGVYILKHVGDAKYIDTIFISEHLDFKHIYIENQKKFICNGTIKNFYTEYFNFENFYCDDSDSLLSKYFTEQPLRPYRAFPFLRMRMNLDSDLGLYYEKIK